MNGVSREENIVDNSIELGHSRRKRKRDIVRKGEFLAMTMDQGLFGNLSSVDRRTFLRAGLAAAGAANGLALEVRSATRLRV